MILLTATIVTFGCRLNQTDSALLADRLRNCGFTIVPEDAEESPSLIIVNSCAVTETAAKKTRQAMKSLRHNHPYSYLVFTGCCANLPEEEGEKLEYDLILPGEKKKDLESILSRRFNIDKKALAAIQEKRNSSPEGEEGFREHAFTYMPFKHRANLKIQDGCNSFCSYCIVPYTRGRERSRAVEEVLADFRNLLAQGYKEIVLTGVNICQYQAGKVDVVELVKMLLKEEGSYRIRIGSVEPCEKINALLELMAKEEKLCDFLHLPLQSGSDTILSAMNRKYTTADYKKYANYAKSLIPTIHIGSDCIVGFPGETKGLFDESFKFIASLDFANLHVFPYSPRKGTKAAEMPGRLTPQEMQERVERFKELKAKCAADYAARLKGTVTTVIPERQCGKGIFEGRTSNYMKIRLASKEADVTGKLLKVKITGASPNNPELLAGKLLEICE